MNTLSLPNDVAEILFGALLAVARADGVVNADELDELRRAAHQLGLASDDEEQLFLLADVSPADLAAAVGDESAPYRGGAGAPTRVVQQAFLEAALRVAFADAVLCGEEIHLLRELAAALRFPTDALPSWRELIDEP